MNADPRDASDKSVLARAQSLIPGEPPAPWTGPIVVPTSGVLAAGWDDQENVVLISWNGYSVTNARTGKRLVRDRDSGRTYDALSPRNESFTLPHDGQRINVFGLVSGDGIHHALDGWELDIIYPWWPRATVVIVRPDTPEQREAYFDRAYAIKLTRLADWEWLRSGFSPLGQHFLIVGSGGVEIFSREDASL